jgi:hypothetical protein
VLAMVPRRGDCLTVGVSLSNIISVLIYFDAPFFIPLLMLPSATYTHSSKLFLLCFSFSHLPSIYSFMSLSTIFNLLLLLYFYFLISELMGHLTTTSMCTIKKRQLRHLMQTQWGRGNILIFSFLFCAEKWGSKKEERDSYKKHKREKIRWGLVRKASLGYPESERFNIKKERKGKHPVNGRK